MPIFGGTEKSKSKQQTDSTIKQTGSQTSKSATQEQQTSTGQTRALSEEASGIFEQLLGGLATQAEGLSGENDLLMNEIAMLAKQATSAAGTAEADINALIDPIIANSRAQMERDIRGRESRLSAAGGSGLSSNVQQLGSLLRSDAESQIASTEGQLRLQGRQAATGERASASQLAAETVNTRQRNIIEQMAIIGDILKGAATTVEQEAAGSATSETETLEELIRKISQTTTGETKGTSELGPGSAALATLGVLSQF